MPSMLSTFQKLRIVLYVILAFLLLFFYPAVNESIRRWQRQRLLSQEELIQPYYEVVSMNGVALYRSNGDKPWSLIQSEMLPGPNVELSVLGEDDHLVLKTIEGSLIGMGAISSLAVYEAEGTLDIKPRYGCFSLDNISYKSTTVFRLAEVRELEKASKSSFCYMEDAQRLFETTEDLISGKKGINSDFPELQIVYPCDYVIEVDDERGRYANIPLSYRSSAFSSKTIFVSSNPGFTDSVFSTRTQEAESVEVELPRGDYFWRIRDDKSRKLTKTCNFSVVHHGDISQKTPLSGDVFLKGSSIEFSWDDQDATRYTVTVIPEDEDRLEFETGSTSVRVSTLERGNYFWFVTSPDGKSSPLRKFYVKERGDIRLLEPRAGDLFDASKKFIKMNWEDFPSVDKYLLSIYSDRQLRNTVYSSEISTNYDFVDNLKEGEYFADLRVRFNSGELIRSHPVRFFIAKADFIRVFNPEEGESILIPYTGLKRLEWEEIPSADEYRVIVNSDEVHKVSESSVTVNLVEGDNTISIYAYCRGMGEKPCALVRNHSFTVSGLVDAPGTPVIRFPFNRNVFSTGEVSIDLSRPRDISGYKIEISSDNSFEDVHELEFTSSSFSFPFESGMYYWRAYSYRDFSGERLYSKPTSPRIFIVR